LKNTNNVDFGIAAIPNGSFWGAERLGFWHRCVKCVELLMCAQEFDILTDGCWHKSSKLVVRSWSARQTI